MNIADWCEKNMPITRQWLDRHAELYKNWREFVAAKKWAFEVGYTSHRQSGLEYALELIAAKGVRHTIKGKQTCFGERGNSDRRTG